MTVRKANANLQRKHAPFMKRISFPPLGQPVQSLTHEDDVVVAKHFSKKAAEEERHKDGRTTLLAGHLTQLPR